MNMKHYPTKKLRHTLTQMNSVYIAVLHFTVTVGSSTMRITRTLNGCETVE